MARDAPPSLSAQKEKSSYLLGEKKARTDLPVFWTPLEMENSPRSGAGRGGGGGGGMEVWTWVCLE